MDRLEVSRPPAPAWLLVIALLVAAGPWPLALAAPSVARPSPIVLQMKPPPEKPRLVVNRAVAEKTRVVLENRVKAYGGQVTLDPNRVDCLLLDIPPDSGHPWSWWRDLVTARGILEFKEKAWNPRTRAEEWVTRLTGDSIAEMDFTLTRRPTILLTFTPQGGRRFAALTTRLVGKPIGIFVDGRVISMPVVREPVTRGEGEISPMKSAEEAETLYRILQSRATPTIVNVLTAPPTP